MQVNYTMEAGGEMTLSKRKISLITTSIILLYILWNYSNIRLYFHSVTTVSEKYESLQQIKDDLNVVNASKYKINSVELFTIDESYLNQSMEEEKKYIDRFSQSGRNKLLLIHFTDDTTVNDINLRLKEVVAREAVSMLYFLNQRKLMDNVEVVHFAYTVNGGFYAMAGSESIIIPIDEFKEELDKNKGKSIEKTLMKLNLHFYDNVLYVNEPEL